jgi:hypothetical protein
MLEPEGNQNSLEYPWNITCAFLFKYIKSPCASMMFAADAQSESSSTKLVIKLMHLHPT